MVVNESEARSSARLGALLDRVEHSLAEALVPVEIFNDPEVFEAEMQRIFAQTWVFVAHESELPKPGDYVLRRIGLDPVIVTRDPNGSVHVLSNYCRHRGSEICLTDRGNSLYFRCRYHGWTYKNNGDWHSAPHLKEAYGGRLDAQEWGLLRAPHVKSYQGLIFACLAEDAPSLESFLGGAAWILDMVFGLHPDGMRVIAPPDRSRLKTDWKIPSENFAGDTYHLDVAHWSVERVELARGLSQSSDIVHTFEVGNGHNFGGHAWAQFVDPSFVFWGYPPQVVEKFDLSGLDPLRRELVRQKAPSIGTLFPNLSLVRVPMSTAPNSRPIVFTSLRQWQPVAPGVVELWNWFLAWNFMSEEEAQQSYNVGRFSSSVGGAFEQDDTAVWQGPARAGASHWMRKAGAQFNFLQAQRSSVGRAVDPAWQGPGIHRTSSYGEHPQLAFYQHWLDVMRRR